MEIKRLYEAEDIDLNTGEVEDNTKNKNILLKLINNRLQELKTLGDALIFACVGLDDENTINSLNDFLKNSSEEINNFKPLAQVIDSEIRTFNELLIPKLNKENITDDILAENPELLKEIYSFKKSVEEPLLENAENADLETFTTEKNRLINKISEEDKSAKYFSELLGTITSDSSEETKNEGPKSGQSWLSYLLTAKKNGNEEQAWDYYYEKVWGPKANVIKGLGKAFRLEVYNYGTKPYGLVETTTTDGTFNTGDKAKLTGNPFISFLNNLSDNIFANLKPDHYNFIHNAVVNDKLSAKDLAAVSKDGTIYGRFGYGNIIYNENFYNNFNGKDLRDLLYLQHRLMVYSGTNENKIKQSLDIMYKGYNDADFKTKACCTLYLYSPEEIGVRIQEKTDLNIKEKPEVTNKTLFGIFSNFKNGTSTEEYLQFLSYVFSLLTGIDSAAADTVLTKLPDTIKTALTTKGINIPYNSVKKFSDILNEYSWNAQSYSELIGQIANKIQKPTNGNNKTK